MSRATQSGNFGNPLIISMEADSTLKTALDTLCVNGTANEKAVNLFLILSATESFKVSKPANDAAVDFVVKACEGDNVNGYILACAALGYTHVVELVYETAGDIVQDVGIWSKGTDGVHVDTQASVGKIIGYDNTTLTAWLMV